MWSEPWPPPTCFDSKSSFNRIIKSSESITLSRFMVTANTSFQTPTFFRSSPRSPVFARSSIGCNKPSPPKCDVQWIVCGHQDSLVPLLGMHIHLQHIYERHSGVPNHPRDAQTLKMLTTFKLIMKRNVNAHKTRHVTTKTPCARKHHMLNIKFLALILRMFIIYLSILDGSIFKT